MYGTEELAERNGHHADPMRHPFPQADRPPDAVFETRSDADGPLASGLTENMQEWLDAAPSPLRPDRAAIQTYVGRSDGDEAVAQLALATVDAEPGRASRRYIADGAIADLDRRLADLERLCEQEVARRDARGRTADLLHLRYEREHALAIAAKAAPLALYSGFFAFGFAAEVSNAVSLLQSSGFGFEGDPWGALCFVFPVVAGPFTALKFLDFSLGPRRRKLLRSRISRVGVPLSAATVGIFAFTIGQLHQHLDLFAEGGGAWTPPLWFLFLASMCSLAAMVTMLPTLMGHAANELFERRPAPNPCHAEADAHVERLRAAIAGTRATRGRLTAVVRHLDAERRLFVDRCVVELRQQRTVLAARRAQLESGPMS